MHGICAWFFDSQQKEVSEMSILSWSPFHDDINASGDMLKLGKSANFSDVKSFFEHL